MALKPPIRIDGRDWSLFKEYDKPYYSYLSFRGKIEYLEKRGQHLEDVIWRGSLMKGMDGDLLVIIGKDSADTEDWGKYLEVFEWRNDRLENIQGLPW